MNKNLCKPCSEALKREGKSVVFQSGGRDNKITCDRCGLRKFGSVYDVRKGRRRAK